MIQSCPSVCLSLSGAELEPRTSYILGKHFTTELNFQLCNITSFDDANVLLSLSFELTKTNKKLVPRPFSSTLCGHSWKGCKSAGKGGAQCVGVPGKLRSPARLRGQPLPSPHPSPQLSQSLLWTSKGQASSPAPRPPGTSPELTHAVLCFLQPVLGQVWGQVTIPGRKAVRAPDQSSGWMKAEVASHTQAGNYSRFPEAAEVACGDRLTRLQVGCAER